MINISPIGRNASTQERHDYEAYDKKHQIRAKFVEALKQKFGHFGLTYVLPPCMKPLYTTPCHPHHPLTSTI